MFMERFWIQGKIFRMQVRDFKEITRTMNPEQRRGKPTCRGQGDWKSGGIRPFPPVNLALKGT